MKVCLLGDTHFGVRNDSKVFHNYYEKFYSEFFFPKLKELGVKQIIQLGDLFDRRKYINFQTLTEARKYFFQPMYDNDIDMHTLLGNHDIFWKESVSVNSPELLLSDYSNITVIKEPTTIEQWNMDLIPWICKENQNDVINFINDSKSYVCCGHFELSGYTMIKNVAPHHDGLSDKILQNYHSVYSGHFHTFSQRNNVTYLGTPYELYWSDYRDQKYIAILDTDTYAVEFIENPYRMFYKVNYDDTKDYGKNGFLGNLQYTMKANSLYKDTYVKLIAVNKTDQNLFDNVVNAIMKTEPADLQIVEDFTSQIESNDDIINQAEDTMTILSKYIDGQELNVASNRLKNLMQELYVEALSLETESNA